MPPDYAVESVRARPGMYVGDPYDGTAVLQLLWEVVGDAVDLALAGECTRVEITLHTEGGATVIDDGPRIPPDVLARALLERHDTATLDGHAWHAHLGSGRGAGLFCVNALSAQANRDW